MSDINNRWVFPIIPDEEDITPVGPNNSAKMSFDRAKWNSLVREAVQNSLDAVDDDSIPVSMKFHFKKLEPSKWPQLINGLKSHIEGGLDFFSRSTQKVDGLELYERKLAYLDNAIKKDTLVYLEISDSNTTGMEYDIDNPTNKVSVFLQGDGVSVHGKATAGGSNGIGKLAYFNASVLNTILLSSMTGTGVVSFMGNARLITNEVNGVKYRDYGSYRGDQKGAVMSVNEIPVLFRRDEYNIGTSFYILGIDTENEGIENIITAIKESICRNYFKAIADKHLDVDIIDDVTHEKNVVTLWNKDFESTLRNIFPRMEDKGQSATFTSLPYYITSSGEGKEEQPTETINIGGVDTEVIKDIVEECPRYHFKANLPHLNEVELWLMLHPNGSGRVAKMRNLRMVVERSKKLGDGIFGVFLCTNDIGSEFLRSLEDPEHKSWLRSNAKDKTSVLYTHDAKEGLDALDNWLKNCAAEIDGTKNQEEVEAEGVNIYIPLSEEEADKRRFDNKASLPGAGTDPKMEAKKEKENHSAEVATIETRGTGGEGEGPNGVHKPDGGRGGGGGKPGDGGRPDGDKPRRVKRKIKTSYHQLPPTKNARGQVEHHIVINSKEEVHNGSLLIKIASDSSAQYATIEYTSNGKVDDLNKAMLKGLSLHEGVNHLTLRFGGNMVYTLKPQHINIQHSNNKK